MRLADVCVCVRCQIKCVSSFVHSFSLYYSCIYKCDACDICLHKLPVSNFYYSCFFFLNTSVLLLLLWSLLLVECLSNSLMLIVFVTQRYFKIWYFHVHSMSITHVITYIIFGLQYVYVNVEKNTQWLKWWDMCFFFLLNEKNNKKWCYLSAYDVSSAKMTKTKAKRISFINRKTTNNFFSSKICSICNFCFLFLFYSRFPRHARNS